jgi:acyl dehydratase
MNHSQAGGTQEIGRKSFTDEDQKLFAAISLDVNPLHMDPLAARRLMTGKQAVHGVHVLLVAVELWRNERHARPTSLRCNFANLI